MGHSYEKQMCKKNIPVFSHLSQQTWTIDSKPSSLCTGEGSPPTPRKLGYSSFNFDYLHAFKKKKT